MWVLCAVKVKALCEYIQTGKYRQQFPYPGNTIAFVAFELYNFKQKHKVI